MDLDARAIELPFERDLALDLCEGFVDIVRRLEDTGELTIQGGAEEEAFIQ